MTELIISDGTTADYSTKATGNWSAQYCYDGKWHPDRNRHDSEHGAMSTAIKVIQCGFANAARIRQGNHIVRTIRLKEQS